MAHGWAPWQSPKAVSRICAPLIHCIPSPGCYPLSQTVRPQVMHFTTQYSRRDEKEMGLSASASHSWGSQMLNHTHSETSSWVSLGTELCHLGGGVTQVKWTCSFNVFNGSNLGCYLLNSVLEPLCWTPQTSTKVLSSVNDYLNQCSLREEWQKTPVTAILMTSPPINSFFFASWNLLLILSSELFI